MVMVDERSDPEVIPDPSSSGSASRAVSLRAHVFDRTL
jgi:hypothetical protein